MFLYTCPILKYDSRPMNKFEEKEFEFIEDRNSCLSEICSRFCSVRWNEEKSCSTLSFDEYNKNLIMILTYQYRMTGHTQYTYKEKIEYENKKCFCGLTADYMGCINYWGNVYITGMCEYHFNKFNGSCIDEISHLKQLPPQNYWLNLF